MYLKNIEVQGFKSFAQKINFEFHNGITGIVGPNGSGKSNVGDAVRWVLGEQSAKQLRGGNMQDVIFSGTELRKPLSFASVAITLDNSDHKLPVDFEEVTVTRRLYRSGESEYRINGSSCRLKDINEMFYDTGIGKEGYSIIGQGQIDKILSGKPEERRELFDEAAGIVKFKRRKNTTLKKLEEEQQNLVRVTDILSELTKQLEPLERQSETAKIYLAKRENLKELDINMFLLEYEHTGNLIRELEEKTRIAENQLKEAQDAHSRTKDEYERLEKILEELNERMEALREESRDRAIRKQQLSGEINVLHEQILAGEQNDSHYRSRLLAVQEDTEKKSADQKALEEQKADLQANLREIDRKLADEQKKMDNIQSSIEECTQAVEDGKNEIIEILNSRANTKGKAQRFDAMKEQLDIRKAGISQRILSLKTQEEEQQSAIDQAQKEYDTITKAIQETREEGSRLTKEIHAIQETLKQQNTQLEKEQTSYHREASRLESLRNITERYDGYGFGIKKVMEQQAVTSGIIGAVADIIKVEEKYETAIETALGGSIQNIVTDTQKTAKKMIEYLKKNRYGRVTFLPLDAVKGKEFARKEILLEPGVIGAANQLVIYDEVYKDLFASLLGQILVVKDMDAGIKIANKYHHSVRIVTLDGDSLNRGGAMSGGAFKNKSNLLGRSREVEELKKKLDRWTKAITEDEEKYHENEKKLKEYQQNMIDLEKEMQEISLELNTQQMSQSAIKRRKEELDNRHEQLSIQRQQLEEELRNAEDDADRLQDEQVDLESANEQDEERIKEISEILEHLRKHAEQHAMEVSKVHMQLSKESQKLEFQENNQERVRSEIEHLSEEVQENQKDTGSINENVKALKQQIEHLKESCEVIERKIIEDQNRHQKMQEEVKEKEVLYKDILKEREEMLERISGYDKEMYRLESQRENRKGKKKELLDYMWENYEITYHQAKQRIDLDETQSLTKVKETISELKNKIKNLGPVNINAVEDYKEVSERYEFMQKQHEDIVTAEAHLTGLMEELEDAMRRQFNAKFKDIKRVFQEVFVELFGGGEARLELTDDDVLESGIRIIAQPPGKKLQNMMQLSGGEKALTAISLLFAIQNLKPSPFCLLDEIEAALDDSNVTRFAKYLHKLTKDTQFIVITHRRGTMMAADVLYGITMQEKGISTQVSVNLIENDLDE